MRRSQSTGYVFFVWIFGINVEFFICKPNRKGIGLKGKIAGEDGKTIIKNVKEMYKKSGDKMQAVANIEDYLNTLADSGYITAAEAADVIEEYRKKAGLYTQEEIKRQKRELSGEEEFVPEG